MAVKPAVDKAKNTPGSADASTAVKVKPKATKAPAGARAPKKAAAPKPKEGVGDAQMLMRQAQDALAKRELSEALRLIDSFLSANPNVAGAHILKARCLERLGQFDGALLSFKDALKINDAAPAALEGTVRIKESVAAMKIAEKAIAKGDAETAIQALQGPVSTGSSSIFRLHLARALLLMGKVNSAQAHIDKFLGEQPGDQDGLAVKAEIQTLIEKREQVSSHDDAGDEAVAAPNAAFDCKAFDAPRTGFELDLQTALAAITKAIESGKVTATVRKKIDWVRDQIEVISARAFQNDALFARAAHFAFADDIDRAIANYCAPLIDRSVDYSYITWPKRIQEYVRNKTILDVGCGFGAYGNGFLVAGAKAYTGIDPAMPLETDSVKNKRLRRKAKLGMTPMQIMAQCPDIHLINGIFEDIATKQVFDTVVLHNVTEHLIRIDQVMPGMTALMHDDSRLVFHHHNFFCWNGHHKAPVQPGQLDPSNPEHLKYADWNHILIAGNLEPDHYFNTSLNQIKLDELRTLVSEYYVIEQWDEIRSPSAVHARLTPERLAILQAHDPELDERELMVNAVLCVARPKATGAKKATAKPKRTPAAPPTAKPTA